jgi:hypothetical protein
MSGLNIQNSIFLQLFSGVHRELQLADLRRKVSSQANIMSQSKACAAFLGKTAK